MLHTNRTRHNCTRMEYEMQVLASSWRDIYIYISSHAAGSQNKGAGLGHTWKMIQRIVSIYPECTWKPCNRLLEELENCFTAQTLDSMCFFHKVLNVSMLLFSFPLLQIIVSCKCRLFFQMQNAFHPFQLLTNSNIFYINSECMFSNPCRVIEKEGRISAKDTGS